jgi:hypothetical protein
VENILYFFFQLYLENISRFSFLSVFCKNKVGILTNKVGSNMGFRPLIIIYFKDTPIK